MSWFDDFPEELLDDRPLPATRVAVEELEPFEAPPISTPADELEAMVGVGKPRPKKQVWSTKQVSNAVQGMLQMRAAKDWSQATPAHLVALYDHSHLHLYGVNSELAGGGREFAGAVSMCKRALEVEFGGDPEEMVAFMHWLWTKKQKGLEDYYKRNGMTDRPRLGWRKVFAVQSAVLVDWRTELGRRGEL